MKTHTFVPTLASNDEHGGRTVPLLAAEITLGRSPRQDVVRGETYVSRQHAVITRSSSGVEIVDQNSAHGTYVNGERVQRQMLRPGDIVQLGSPQAPVLRFILQRTGQAPESSNSFAGLLETLSGFPASPPAARTSGAREMEQLNFLLTAARTLHSGRATHDIFGALLQLSIELTGAERGFVFLWTDAKLQLALGLSAEGQELSGDPSISSRAMRKAVEGDASFLVEDTLSDSDAGEWSSVVIHQIRSVYCIPLRKRAADVAFPSLLGLLYLDSKTAPGRLTEVDHQLLDAIATEAAALLHNALLAEADFKAQQAQKELAIAAEIHAGLMSIALPTLSFATICGRSLPCLAIGGDFYDAVALEGCLGITIADVSGKGVSSAIVAATLQGIIHAQMLAGNGLREIASLVNQFLCTRQVGKYATLILLKLYADGRLEHLNCGHIQPTLLSGGEIHRLTEHSLVVGLIKDAVYTPTSMTLQPGDRLLLATDGITEAENSKGQSFGDTGLYGIARENSLEDMLDQVAQFLGASEAQDDRTLLEICYTG